MAQTYTDSQARERMAAGLCPECGEMPSWHSGMGGPHSCTLTDNGAAQRIAHFRRETPDPLARVRERANGVGHWLTVEEARAVIDEIDRLRAIEQRARNLRDDTRPTGNRRPGPAHRIADQILGESTARDYS